MRPRIRTIKPDFFANPGLNTIGVGSRYVALGLISMADDRGRILLMLPALRTYVFPSGDVSEKQCNKALTELGEIGFVWRYEVAPWSYLWIPGFWRHQKINRPSESPLPPHPRDPYRDMSVLDALAQFKEDSDNGHGSFSESSLSVSGDLITSRAGAPAGARSNSHSIPVSNDEVSSRPRASRHVDQTVPPVDFPEALLPRLDAVLMILLRSWVARRGIKPEPRGAGLAMLRNPAADHEAVARRLEQWLTTGKGQRAACGDICARFGDWIEEEPAVAAVGQKVVQISEKQARRDRGAAALDALLGDQGLGA